MRQRFFRQNLLRLGIMVLIPLLVMGLFSIIITNRYIVKQINDLSINSLFQVRETLDNLFLDIHNLDAGISTNFGMQVTLKKMLADSKISYHDNLTLNLISHNLIAKTASNPVIHSVYLYFENPQNRFFTSDMLRIADISQYSDTEWFKLLQQNVSRWSSPRQIKLNTVEDSVTVVTSFHNMLWKSGIIVTNISVSSVSRILSQVEHAASQSLAVTSNEDQILFFCINFAKLPEQLKIQLSNIRDTTTLKADGKKYRVSRLYSPETELNYISIIPQYQLDILPRQITIITFILLFCTLVLVMGIAYRTACKSYNSLQEISNIIHAHDNEVQYIVKPLSDSDIYENIISNIILSLIERSRLKEQLEKNKYQNQALELMALQAQMNPHFLFNTMETIYWKTLGLTKSPNESTALIEWLSDMLHYSLSSRPFPVTLFDEIANAKNYINIQQIRFQDRFKVMWQVDERASIAKTLKLLLQPLIENCLTHAISREKMILIRIGIRLLPGDNLIQITVADNGCGITAAELEIIRGKLKQGFTADNHVGLFNTNKRILLTYGEKASFSIYSREGVGTLVRLVYPVI